MEVIGSQLPVVELADISDLSADGVRARLYRPSMDAGLPLLVFLHGGGWFLGNLETHDAMHRHLAALAGSAVLAVEYRLAPEHPFPAGLEDALAAFSWARREAMALGCDPKRIALGGESAGANLTAAMTLSLRDRGLPQPLFQLLVHPATDLSFTLPSLTSVEAPGLRAEYLRDCIKLYAGTADVSDPLLSPLKAASLSGLAPAIVLTASEDPLRDDGEYFAAALVRDGVETTACRLQGLPHGFLFLPITVPAVASAYRTVARLIRRHFECESVPDEH
jgi:acetyl esterase